MENKLQLPRRLFFLIKLSYFKGKSASISDYERYLGYHSPQPDVRETLQFLIEKEILIYYGKLLWVKQYKLNIKKLRDFLDELPAINELYEYFNEHHIVTW